MTTYDGEHDDHVDDHVDDHDNGDHVPEVDSGAGPDTAAESADGVSGVEARRQARAARRATKASEAASRAQAKADEARRRALEAARDSGIIPADYSGAGPSRAEEPGDAADAATSVDPAAGPGPTTAATGRPESDDDPAAAAGTTDERSRTGTAPAARVRAGLAGFAAGRRGRLRVAAVALAAVVLLGLTALSSILYAGARDEVALEEAITAAPDDALEASRGIVTDMFTYDWESVEEAMNAVEPRLTGVAAEEFRTSSRPAVMTAARDERASVFATVAAAGVETVHDAENVTVLVMVNRMISTEEEPEAQTAASRLSVDMQLVDGEWKLAELASV